jgi:hypothetical protein
MLNFIHLRMRARVGRMCTLISNRTLEILRAMLMRNGPSRQNRCREKKTGFCFYATLQAQDL